MDLEALLKMDPKAAAAGARMAGLMQLAQFAAKARPVLSWVTADSIDKALEEYHASGDLVMSLGWEPDDKKAFWVLRYTVLDATKEQSDGR